MSVAPNFWRTPLTYAKYASREKPAYFYMAMIALVGPVGVLIARPTKRYFGVEPRPMIPMTYPGQ